MAVVAATPSSREMRSTSSSSSVSGPTTRMTADSKGRSTSPGGAVACSGSATADGDAELVAEDGAADGVASTVWSTGSLPPAGSLQAAVSSRAVITPAAPARLPLELSLIACPGYAGGGQPVRGPP